MKTLRFGVRALVLGAVAACGSGSPSVTGPGMDGGKRPDSGIVTGPDTGAHVDTGVHADVQVDAFVRDAGQEDQHDATTAGDAALTHQDAGGCGVCPTGYTCSTANGLPVCRAPSGVPLFKHVFLIMEENTSLSTLMTAMTSNGAPSFNKLRTKYASGSDYHGVSHPSLPNYIALTSGDTQGIGCDCHAQPGQGTCGTFSCNLILGGCTCTASVKNLADQLETANKTWMAFGEGMGTPCNLVDDSSTSYAVRHVPFLYYDDIQTDATRCAKHVVDYSSFAVASAPEFTYIAPSLIDDMHDPVPASAANITAGDKWIGSVVDGLLASSAYTDGGLIIIVWDEDDGSGGITGSDDPIPIFVLSPYAKSAGYVSAATMDHYSLLATLEDAFGLPRLGNAGVPRTSTADSLADYFPAK